MKKSIEKIAPAPEVTEFVPDKDYKTDSIYRGIVVSCQRVKQLIKGAEPRTSPEFSFKRKSTRIAVEEVRLGLVAYDKISDDVV